MDYSSLEQFLSSHEAEACDSDEVSLCLQQYKDGLLKLLDFKGPSAESRRQVQQRRVLTAKYGWQDLDAVSDVPQIVLLCDELRLDEALCVEYLITAYDERGIFGAEYAAGMYLEERLLALRCLARLLVDDARLQYAQHHAGQRTPYAQAIASFVSELLGEKAPSGKQILVSRLVAMLRDTSLEPRPDTALPYVRDEAGNAVARTLLLQRERREAARCLIYCAARDPHVAPAVAVELLELMAGLLSKLGGTGSGDLFLVEECHLVLLACCNVLVPHEGRNFQQVALQELAQVTRTKVEAVGQVGYSACLRLCWGLLGLCSQAAPQDGVAAVREALKSGALSFLRQVSSHPHFPLNDETHQHVAAAVMHQVVATLLRVDGERTGNSFYTQLLHRSEAAIRPSTHSSHTQLMYVPFPPESPEARSDHLGSLLGLLADCFEAFPELYLANLADQEAGQRPVKEFLDRAINSNIMRGSPEVRVPFLHLIAALATTERGVHLVLRQMDAMAQVPALEVLTLRKLFQTIVTYCLRFFSTISEMQRQMQVQGGIGAVQGGAFAQHEAIMNPSEADILVAFLKLLKRVLEFGRPAEVQAFWSSMTAHMAPALNGFLLHEPLFQLMCYPVQNHVKAALDEVLGTLAAALPDMAARLLERLLQCTIVRPAAAMMPTVPRLDIVQQLNEVEARREEYPETLALIRLLNSLLGPFLRQAGAGVVNSACGLPDGGADVTTFTLFIQQHVLGHLWSRGYRLTRQKWEVAAAAFTHLEHVLDLATRESLPPPQPASEASANPKCPPGYLIMHDLLGGGPAYAALLHILSPGYASLTALQSQTDEVGAREAAVLAGLRVINAALRLDLTFVEQLARLNLTNRYQPLHLKMLSGGVRLLAVLLQYVCYPENADIQVEVIRLTLEMSRRMPNLVDELSRAGNDNVVVSGALAYIPASEMGGTVGAAETAAALAATAADLADVLGSLRRGFAMTMAQGLASPNALDNLDTLSDRPQGASDVADPRFALVLRLLLQNAAPSVPSPSISHLLLGYDMECALGGRLDETVLLPQEFSCLSVVVRMLDQPNRFACKKPKLFSQCLCLLHSMASAAVGGLPMLEYLSPRATKTITGLRLLLNMELPSSRGGPDGSESTPHELSAALHSRSWYMRIASLLLLRLEHEDSSRQLLLELLAAPGVVASDSGGEGAVVRSDVTADGAGGSVAGTSTLLDTMRVVSALALPEPQLSDLSQDQRRMLQDLSSGEAGLEQLLMNPSLMQNAGLAMTSDAGDLIISVDALYSLIRQRVDAFAARAGGAVGGAADAAADAARAALSYAQRHNAYVLLSGAQVAAVEAWQQLVQVIFTRQYELLDSLLRSNAAEALYDTLTASLETVRTLMSRMDGTVERAAGPLCTVARVLVSKLQEQAVLHVSLGQAADPLASVRVPIRCQALLRLLVDLILRAHAQRAPPVRLQLYAAALQYLQFSRGSKLATSCAPAVLTALLQSWGSGSDAVAAIDQSEELIERANATVISAHGVALVEALAADALNGSGPQLGQAVSLHLLRALLTVDSAAGGAAGAIVAAAAYRQGVPQQVLAHVAALPAATLTAGGKRSRQAVHVLEAALALLEGLAVAGPPAARATAVQQLYSLNCITALNRCAALDLVPDDPATAPLRAGLSFPSVAVATDSVRFRLNALTAPVLRLLLKVVATLPDSTAVRADAAAFAAGHHQLLCRLMGDAAVVGARGWSPGDAELELADLALGLLVRLVPSLPSMQPLVVESLNAMAFKLAFQFCCLEERSSSSIIQQLRASHQAAARRTVSTGGIVGPGAIMLATPLGAAPARPSGSRSAVCNRTARVLSVRCSLSRLLRDMAAAAASASTLSHVAAGGAYASAAPVTSLPAGMLRAMGGPEHRELDPLTGRPTLMLVRDLAQQVCRDAAAALDELTELLAMLRLPDMQLDEQTVTDRLLAYAPAGSATVAAAMAAGSSTAGLAARRRLARHYWALAATSLDSQLSRSLFVLEAALSTVVIHFLRFLPRPLSTLSPLLGNGKDNGANGAADMAMDTDELLDQATADLDLLASTTAPTQADAAALGSPDEVQYLLTLLQDTCLQAEELLSRLAEASSDAAAGPAGGYLLGSGGDGVSGAFAGRAGVTWSTRNAIGFSAGPSEQRQPLEGIDLMVRTLKMYCSRV